MKFFNVFILLFISYALGTVINNVRLRDHTGYMINVITKTLNVMEQRGWCNFKLPENVQHLNENVLNTAVTGEVRYTNGFVVSIQRVDIQQSTVQQVWFHNTTTQATTVTVRGTLRMMDVAIGYDVVADLSVGRHHYTSFYVQPFISFAFSVIKNLQTEDVSVTVVGAVQQTNTIRPVFRPRDNISDVLTTLYNPATISAAGIITWGPQILQPIAEDIVTNRVKFPTFCYNCPTTVS